MKKHEGNIGRILNHLIEQKRITSIEAFEKYGVTRLSAIIFKLRGEGYLIESVDKMGTNRYGDEVRFVSYELKEEPDV